MGGNLREVPFKAQVWFLSKALGVSAEGVQEIADFPLCVFVPVGGPA